MWHSNHFCYALKSTLQSYNPGKPVWPVPLSLAATDGITFVFFSSCYWDVSLRKVSPQQPMYSVEDLACFHVRSFLIRRSTGHSFLSAYRSLSQISTSFVAFKSLGIHHNLLVTYYVWYPIALSYIFSFFALVLFEQTNKTTKRLMFVIFSFQRTILRENSLKTK